MEPYAGAERVQCCLCFRESQSPASVQRKFRSKYHKKITPKNGYCSVVQSVRWNLLCISQQSRQGRPCVQIETTENVWQTFVRNPRKSTKRATWECVRFWRNDYIESHKDYKWCKLWAIVTKKNDMSLVVKCLTKCKTKMITWIKLWLAKRQLFIWVVRLIVIMGYREPTWDRRTCVTHQN